MIEGKLLSLKDKANLSKEEVKLPKKVKKATSVKAKVVLGSKDKKDKKTK